MSALFYDGVDHMIEKITTLIKGKANNSHKHDNGDITSLDAGKITSGTISIDRLPQGALDRLIKVVDDTARFKLTTKDVQLGDSVKVTSTKKMYIVVDETKLSSEDGYEPYTADSATSVPWSGVTGKPNTYTPSSHTHTKSQITDFPTSMPANGGSATNSSNVIKNANFNDSNIGRMSYYDANVSNTENNATWSAPSKGWYQIYHNDLSVDGYWTEMAFPINDENGLSWRQHRGSDNYYGWYRILDSNNYGNYTVGKTGSGASGTWGINITGSSSSCTGNAATTTNASKVNNHSVESDVPANAKFTDTIYDDTEVKEAIDTLNKETTVNLLPEILSVAKNGVTLTNNGDGTYTLTGTATDDAHFVIVGNIIQEWLSNKLPLKLLGGISNNVYVEYKNTFDDNKSIADKGTGGVIINDVNNDLLCITVLAGEILPNVVIKPMLTTNLNATYDDFVPYTGDSGSLNGDVASLSKRIKALKKGASYESGTFTGTLFNKRGVEFASATGFYKKVETMVYIYVAVINNVGSPPIGLKGLPFNTLGGLSLNNKSELFAYDSEKKQIIRPNQISNNNQVLFDSGVLSMEGCVELWGWYRI